MDRNVSNGASSTVKIGAVFSILVAGCCLFGALVVLWLRWVQEHSIPVSLPAFTEASIVPGLLPTATNPPTSTLEPTPSTTQANPQPLPPIPADAAVILFHGDRSSNQIALTFDACETEGDSEASFDTEIARILVETQTPATIFLGGLWMRDHPEETKYLASQPIFDLGNHSWSHLDFASITTEEMKREIEKTQETMWELIGRQAHFFRFPFGTYNEQALVAVRQAGMYAVQWDVVSGDPDPNIDAGRMIEAVVREAQPGSIIIMHINGRGWHTAEALPEIIRQLQEKGFEFVTVSELLGLD